MVRARRKATWPSRPNVHPYGAWYGWPWYSRMPLGTRRHRAELWLLEKRYDLAVRLLGRERARPFDYIPF